MKLLRIILLILLPLNSSAQVDELRPEFRNLSWIMDDKAAEIVTTLSYYYGDTTLMQETFPSTYEYNMYYDSLSLWYITKEDLVYKKDDSTAKATIMGDIPLSDKPLTEADWLILYRANTAGLYDRDKGTKNAFCIPTSYENLEWFESTESKRIKTYNSSRIKSYEYTHKTDGKTVINYWLVFHETIEPTGSSGAKMGVSPWVPYLYTYDKPKAEVKKSTPKQMWESNTGLPYQIALDLQLDSTRIEDIVRLLGVVNEDVLFLPSDPYLPGESYGIFVDCDTCELMIFDNQAQDGDIVEFTYEDTQDEFMIKNSGTNYTLILDSSNSFILKAISEGSSRPCTIYLRVEEQEHILRMYEGEEIKIILNRNQ